MKCVLMSLFRCYRHFTVDSLFPEFDFVCLQGSSVFLF